MFNNIALDVFIALVFIFLLYSLLATIVQEIIARQLSLRTRNLHKAIQGMLDDREAQHTRLIIWDDLLQFFQHIGASVSRTFKPFPRDSFSKAFYDHPTIKYLGESGWRSKPSYISPAAFSQTLVQLLRGGDSYDGQRPQMDCIEQTLFTNKSFKEVGANGKTIPIEPDTLSFLQQSFLDAEKDVDNFKRQLENWFNDTMDRTAGWYKKQTQLILFLLGFSFAILFNVDTIAIYRILSKDKGARDRLVELAVKSTPTYDTIVKELTKVPVLDSISGKNAKGTGDSLHMETTYTIVASDARLDSAYHLVMNDIDNAGSILGLGWPDKDSCKRCDSLQMVLKAQAANTPTAQQLRDRILTYQKAYFCVRGPYQRGAWQMLAGWLITALAISLGAPFWFDLLSKIVALRSAGAKPDPDSTSATTPPGNGTDPGQGPNS